MNIDVEQTTNIQLDQLVAAMRCYVVSELGHTVEIPDYIL